MKHTASLSLCLLAACGGGSGPGGPNVILVSIDSLRADHVGCYGYERDTTPHLDRLAREGVRFAQQVSSSSWTLPAHAALFTSVADSVHGCVEATGTALNPDFVTLAERFGAAGYATGGFYGGPYLHEAFGLGQGFDTYVYAVEENREVFPGEKVEAWGNNPLNHARTHRGVTNGAVYGAASRWMAEQAGGPFFAFVHLWDVHYDFTPPPPWDTRFDPGYQGPIDGSGFAKDHQRYRPDMEPADLRHLIALYDGEIAWTDTFLGQLRTDLEAWGIAGDTILAVTSDHGTEFFEHGTRGHRQTLFDEVVHVPLVLWAPGLLEPGRVVEGQTRMIDLGPTLLELADLSPPEGIMGESLAPAARGGALDIEPTAVCELYSIGFELRAVRTAGGKFLSDSGGGEGALESWFDLTSDPGEQSPSVAVEGGRGAELREVYLRALQDLDEAIAHRPGDSVPTDLSEEIRASLRANGYTGGD